MDCLVWVSVFAGYDGQPADFSSTAVAVDGSFDALRRTPSQAVVTRRPCIAPRRQAGHQEFLGLGIQVLGNNLRQAPGGQPRSGRSSNTAPTKVPPKKSRRGYAGVRASTTA